MPVQEIFCYSGLAEVLGPSLLFVPLFLSEAFLGQWFYMLVLLHAYF